MDDEVATQAAELEGDIDAGEIVYGPRLSKTERAILGYLKKLIDHDKDKNGFCWPSTQFLAEQFGVCHRTINRAIENMRDQKILTVTRARWKDKVRSLYRVNPVLTALALQAKSKRLERERPRPASPLFEDAEDAATECRTRQNVATDECRVRQNVACDTPKCPVATGQNVLSRQDKMSRGDDLHHYGVINYLEETPPPGPPADAGAGGGAPLRVNLTRQQAQRQFEDWKVWPSVILKILASGSDFWNSIIEQTQHALDHPGKTPIGNIGAWVGDLAANAVERLTRLPDGWRPKIRAGPTASEMLARKRENSLASEKAIQLGRDMDWQRAQRANARADELFAAASDEQRTQWAIEAKKRVPGGMWQSSENRQAISAIAEATLRAVVLQWHAAKEREECERTGPP